MCVRYGSNKENKNTPPAPLAPCTAGSSTLFCVRLEHGESEYANSSDKDDDLHSGDEAIDLEYIQDVIM